MFNLNLNKLILWLLPEFMRKPVNYAYLKSLCWPAMQIFNDFTTQRKLFLYQVEHNSQVFSMENVLNDRFDSAGRSIYITDGFTKPRIYVYTRLEDKPLTLGTVSLHNRADYADTGVDFIIWVPTAVLIQPQDLIEMNALVNFYKLAGKRFKIYRV